MKEVKDQVLQQTEQEEERNVKQNKEKHRKLQQQNRPAAGEVVVNESILKKSGINYLIFSRKGILKLRQMK